MENFGSFAKAQLCKLYNQVQDVSSMVSHTIIQHQKPSPNLAEVVLTVYIDINPYYVFYQNQDYLKYIYIA